MLINTHSVVLSPGFGPEAGVRLISICRKLEAVAVSQHPENRGKGQGQAVVWTALWTEQEAPGSQ